MKKEYDFLKLESGSESSLVCSVCNSTINIAKTGITAIKVHVKSAKHMKQLGTLSSNKLMDSFLDSNPAIFQLKAKELAFSYHVARHRISARTGACTSKLVKTCFDSQFSCSSTSLETAPNFTNDIKPSVDYVTDRLGTDIFDIDALFDEANLLRQRVTGSLTTWNENEVPSEARWLEVLKDFAAQNRRINQFELLVEFGFAIPGFSADVERTFSYINDVWGPDKPQMKLDTLEAQLNVKINSDLDCCSYYDTIKNNKKLLAQVKNKAVNKSQEGASPSADQEIEISDDEEEDE